jgi:hypothetical protein
VESTRLDFLSEWKALLEKLFSTLKASRIHITDQEQFNQLCRVFSEIQDYGAIYRVGINLTTYDDKPEPSKSNN